MDIRSRFAANLRALRADRGYSQEALAHEAGINRSYFSKLETGKTYAGLEIIEKLSVILKVDPADLLKPRSAARAVKVGR